METGCSVVTADQSILDDDGRVPYFSAERFLREIVETENCFLCARSPEETAFNDEHVIPDWILRKFGMENERINLPGEGSGVRYSQYKVPCCKECNTLLGETLENPVAKMVAGGYEAVVRHLREQGPRLLFVWMNLIFLKTHLKDRKHRMFRDERKPRAMLSELVEWPEMHPIHCVVRTVATGAQLEPEAFGSLLVWRAASESPLGDYDYADYYPGQAMMVRLGEIVLFAVLNDAGLVLSAFAEPLKLITGPLSALQCREQLAHLAYANTLIAERPVFHTRLGAGGMTIGADMPSNLRTGRFEPEQFGKILGDLFQPMWKDLPIANKEAKWEQLRAGRLTFLFGADGAFVKNAPL